MAFVKLCSLFKIQELLPALLDEKSIYCFLDHEDCICIHSRYVFHRRYRISMANIGIRCYFTVNNNWKFSDSQENRGFA